MAKTPHFNTPCEALKAAIQRAKEVPQGTTLIDTISDEDFFAEGADNWNICCGKVKETA